MQTEPGPSPGPQDLTLALPLDPHTPSSLKSLLEKPGETSVWGPAGQSPALGQGRLIGIDSSLPLL